MELMVVVFMIFVIIQESYIVEARGRGGARFRSSSYSYYSGGGGKSSTNGYIVLGVFGGLLFVGIAFVLIRAYLCKRNRTIGTTKVVLSKTTKKEPAFKIAKDDGGSQLSVKLVAKQSTTEDTKLRPTTYAKDADYIPKTPPPPYSTFDYKTNLRRHYSSGALVKTSLKRHNSDGAPAYPPPAFNYGY